MKRVKHLLPFLAMSLLVGSTTTFAVAAQEVDAKARKAALEQRVLAKWDALIKNDFATAYTFTSPAYRKLYSLDFFKSGFGGKVKWQRVEVTTVDFKGDDAASVGITIHFMYYQKETEQTLNMKNHVKEPWVLVDGQWWYVMSE
jgi:hypothetical protein